MKKLEIEKTKKIIGGGITIWGGIGIASLITFVAGVIDGFARPFKCH